MISENTATPKPSVGAATGPLSVQLPVETRVLNIVRERMSGGDLRMDELAEIILRDPVLTLELLSFANRLDKGTHQAILSVKAALFRLGSEGVCAMLDEIATRPVLDDSEVCEEFEKLHHLSNRISGIARILSSIVLREYTEEARIIGSMATIGQMVACVRLQRVYVELARELSRASLVYRLGQDFRFDMRGVQLNYLKTREIPQTLFFVFDREFQCKAPGQAALRFVIDSAVEMVENFEHGKFYRYSPDAELPGKSSLRLLKLNSRQHAQIFEECGDFLRAFQADENTPSDLPPPSAAVEVAPNIQSEIEGTFEAIDYIEAGETEESSEDNGFSPKAQLYFETLKKIFAENRNTEDLLSRLLVSLVTDGPFERAALMVIHGSQKLAVIRTAAGDIDLPSGKRVEFQDPISPLALCSTKIRSFNSKSSVDLQAPFGVTAYALSPIKVRHGAPVVLYVDCGKTKSLPFEARKVFRLVVGLLNSILAETRGGLPAEATLANVVVSRG